MQKKKIIWLSSYPKSGNTWFRAFLTEYMQPDGLTNINKLILDAHFAERTITNYYADVDSEYLLSVECLAMRKYALSAWANESTKNELFIKTHDAWQLLPDKSPILPIAESKCVVYFVRNPLDIATSYASHINIGIQESVELICNDKTKLTAQNNNNNLLSSFPQLLGNWSSHVSGWLNQQNIPIIVIRYEDMLNNTYDCFVKAINFMQISKSEKKIVDSIEKTSFSTLRKMEEIKGFKQINRKDEYFFRNGKAGNWKYELTEDQIMLIWNKHHEMMTHFGYTI